MMLYACWLSSGMHHVKGCTTTSRSATVAAVFKLLPFPLMAVDMDDSKLPHVNAL